MCPVVRSPSRPVVKQVALAIGARTRSGRAEMMVEDFMAVDLGSDAIERSDVEVGYRNQKSRDI